MLNAADDRSQETGRLFREIKARVTWILLAGWTVTALIGWLVVTVTDGGLNNLQWVIGPPAVITVMGYAVWRHWTELTEKQETLAGLGFHLAETEAHDDIGAGIESLFDAHADAAVLGTRAILPDVQCWIAEVTESLDRDTEETVSRTSTVCLFENSGEQLCSPHAFQLSPHNSVARMLCRSVSAWFNRSATSGFHVWYDAAPDEDSGRPEFLTPELCEWLGKHSRWSKMRPWSLVDVGKRTLIYRTGTVYEKEKYQQFVFDMQVFAGLRFQAGMTISGAPVTDSAGPSSDADWCLQEGLVARSERDRLLDQVPIRDLTPYWRNRTRVEPVLLVLFVCLGAIGGGFVSGQLVRWIQRVTGVVLDQSWGIAIAAGLVTVRERPF